MIHEQRQGNRTYLRGRRVMRRYILLRTSILFGAMLAIGFGLCTATSQAQTGNGFLPSLSRILPSGQRIAETDPPAPILEFNLQDPAEKIGEPKKEAPKDAP